MVQLTGGGGHSFLLHKDGRVFGCGWNNVGQISSTEQDVHRFTPVQDLEDYEVAQITSNWDSSYAITKTGQCIGWGANTFGQLARQRPIYREPIELTDKRGLQIEAGLKHCAILTKDGVVMTSGDGSKGQLGRSLTQLSQAYQRVPELSRVKSIACGQHQTFALTMDRKLYGWGCNKFGQLGIDPTLHQTVRSPLEISLPQDSIDDNTTIHSGWVHAALLTGNGKIINWGRNKYGQLGCAPYDRPIEWKPQEMNNIKKVKNLYIGSEHNIAILDDGVLMGWGWNEHGSCGMEHFNDVVEPAYVKINNKAVVAGLGVAHTLVIVVTPNQYH